MSPLVLHLATQRLVDAYLSRPTHGLLLSGQRGVGLLTLACTLSMRIDPRGLTHEVLPDDKATIAIETIRGLYRLTRTHREHALVVIIDDAEAMGREAQNALLKLLEEPVEQVYFILTSHVPQLLLPTITSRTQHIDVRPISLEQTKSLISEVSDPMIRSQLLFLGRGLPAEITRLQQDQTYFTSQTQQTSDARAFLEGDSYTRLKFVKQYSVDRSQASGFLGSITTLLTFMLFAKQQPELAVALEKVEDIAQRLSQNAHVKTQLVYLVTTLS